MLSKSFVLVLVLPTSPTSFFWSRLACEADSTGFVGQAVLDFAEGSIGVRSFFELMLLLSSRFELPSVLRHLAFQFPITPNQRVSRTIVPKLRFRLGFKLRDDALGEHLP